MTLSEIIWRPYGYYRTSSNLARFMADYGYESYADLRPDTGTELTQFWDAVMDDVDVVWAQPYEETLEDGDVLKRFPQRQ